MAFVQRIIVMVMAAAMVFIFLLPLALSRGNYAIAAAIVAIFTIYLGINAWIFIRMRRRS